TARRTARGGSFRSTGRRGEVGRNARGSRWTGSTAERLRHLGKHIGEQVVTACQLVAQPPRVLERSAGKRLDQALGVVTVQGEATLRIIDDGAGRDDELPVGGLRQQQLARRLRQHPARGGGGQCFRRHVPEGVFQEIGRAHV